MLPVAASELAQRSARPMPEQGATFYDRQEVRDPAEREAAMFHALPGLLRHALDNAPYLADHLGGVEPDAITSPARLAALPVLRKSELSALQARRLPFGGLAATPLRRLARVFASPGPIYDPEGARPDYWRFARAMYAAGFRAGDVVHNSFSYHLTPAGSMAESGARALGLPVLPGGTAPAELQLRALGDIGATAYVGTPSFLVTLLEKGRELGRPPATLTKALVSGEGFPAATRARLAQEFAVRAVECYASADLGLIAYESVGGEGLIVDEAVIVEIVRPGTGDPVAEGEVGEVVVTVFNPDYPLIRFATGDLSALLPGQSPCGRTNRRLRGWLGRADQAAKVRGQFVRPEQMAELVRRHAEVAKARLVVTRVDDRDVLRLCCEVTDTPEGLAERLVAAARALAGLRTEVELVAPGSLPNDGRVIDDRR